MAKEDFDLFWNSHLHTPDSSGQAAESEVLYWHSLKEETVNYPWSRREASTRQHALAAVARDLMTQVRVATKKTNVTVTVLQNLSPCVDCAGELLKAVTLAKEKKIKLEVSLAFVTLHRVRRVSCAQRGHNCAIDICINESNDNSYALRHLSQEGVKLTTFTPPLWQFLFTFTGLGLPLPLHHVFLSAKYSGSACQQRWMEDTLVANELHAILTGVQMRSGCASTDADSYLAEWTEPQLAPGKRVTDYRISYKKITVKNKDAEDPRHWKLQQTSSTPVKVTVPGQMTSHRLESLERDTFYEMTVEALLGQLVVCSARRIFRTDDKAPIASLATPKKPLVRSNSRASTSSLSPRTPNNLAK